MLYTMEYVAHGMETSMVYTPHGCIHNVLYICLPTMVIVYHGIAHGEEINTWCAPLGVPWRKP